MAFNLDASFPHPFVQSNTSHSISQPNTDLINADVLIAQGELK